MEINYLLLFIICFVEQISSQGMPVLVEVHLLVRLQDERVRLDSEPFIQRHFCTDGATTCSLCSVRLWLALNCLRWDKQVKQNRKVQIKTKKNIGGRNFYYFDISSRYLVTQSQVQWEYAWWVLVKFYLVWFVSLCNLRPPVSLFSQQNKID